VVYFFKFVFWRNKTGYKPNAGGHDVVFDEVLTINKDLMYGKLVVSVWDKDTFR